VAGPPFLFERSPVSEEIGCLRKDMGREVFRSQARLTFTRPPPTMHYLLVFPS
jgi:hypothetical protein